MLLPFAVPGVGQRIQILLFLLIYVGPLSCVALALIAADLGWIPSKKAAMYEFLTNHAITAGQVDIALTRSLERQTQLLRSICRGNARALEYTAPRLDRNSAQGMHALVEEMQRDCDRQ